MYMKPNQISGHNASLVWMTYGPGFTKNQNHRRWNKNSTIALLDKIILCYVLSSSSACCFKKSVVVLFKNYLSVLLPRLITITATAKRKRHLQKHKRSHKSEKKIGQVLIYFVESDEPRDQDIAGSTSGDKENTMENQFPPAKLQLTVLSRFLASKVCSIPTFRVQQGHTSLSRVPKIKAQKRQNWEKLFLEGPLGFL